MRKPTLTERIAELEDTLRQRDEKVAELRVAEHDALKLVNEMRDELDDWLQWVQTIAEPMTTVHDGEETNLWDWCLSLVDKNAELEGELARLERLTERFDGDDEPKPMGRPLNASAMQVEDVLDRHRRGESLRAIAAATDIGLATVRSIIRPRRKVAVAAPVVDEAKRARERELNRLRAAAYRKRYREQERSDKRLVDLRKRSAKLLKAAKGLDEV